MYIQPKLWSEKYSHSYNTWMYFVINLGFMVGYFLLLYFYKKTYKTPEKIKGIVVLSIFAISAEVIFNGYSTYYKDTSLWPSNYYDSYKLWNDTTEDALSRIKNEDSGFYRINCKNDYTINGALYFNYNGIASFSNMENYFVRRTLGLLGVATSPRLISPEGLTDFTKMILGVKYEIESVDFGNHKNYVLDFDQAANILRNDYALSLGFLVDDGIVDFSFKDDNEFLNTNDVASAMAGEEVNLFDMVTGGMTYDELGVELVEEDNSFVFEYRPTSELSNAGLIYFNIPLEDRDAYVQFEYDESVMDTLAPYIVDANTGEMVDYDRLGMSSIKKMSEREGLYSIGILMGDGFTYDRVYVPQKFNFAYYNQEEFEKVYDILSKNQMDIIEFKNGYVKGQISVNEDNKVLFTSIPYDEGWEIRVNNNKVEPIMLLDNAFIGIPLSKGEYDLEFKYNVPGLATGICIALASFCLLMIAFAINPKVKVEKREKIEKKEEDI